MKKTLLLCFLFIASGFLFGQNATRDVIQLKNGSIIKGMITEQILGQNVTIEMTDGSRLVYSVTEIEKITKEQLPQYSTLNKKKKMSYYSLNLGLATDFEEIAANINLVELNIASRNGWGGTLKWGASSKTENEISSGFGYLLVGPSYTFAPLPNGTFTTLRAMIGGAKPVATKGNQTISGKTELMFDLGASMRFAAYNNWSFLVGTDLMVAQESVFLNLNVGFSYNW